MSGFRTHEPVAVPRTREWQCVSGTDFCAMPPDGEVDHKNTHDPLKAYHPPQKVVVLDGVLWSARRPVSTIDVERAHLPGELHEDGSTVLGLIAQDLGGSARDAFVYVRLEQRFGRTYFRQPVYTDVPAITLKQALWEKGTSLGEIARANGVDRRDLGRAIAPSDDDALRQLVADALELPLHQLWPSLYRTDGQRHHRRAPFKKGQAS